MWDCAAVPGQEERPELCRGAVARNWARELPTGLYDCSNMRDVISSKSSAEVIAAVLNARWV